MIKTYTLHILGAALVLFALERAGFWIWFSAHPSWSLSGLGIGMIIGLAGLAVAAGLTKWRGVRPLPIALGFVALLIIAIACTKFGKAGFVNSYAENRLAGKFWYFGYMGTIAAVFATSIWITMTAKKIIGKS